MQISFKIIFTISKIFKQGKIISFVRKANRKQLCKQLKWNRSSQRKRKVPFEKCRVLKFSINKIWSQKFFFSELFELNNSIYFLQPVLQLIHNNYFNFFTLHVLQIFYFYFWILFFSIFLGIDRKVLEKTIKFSVYWSSMIQKSDGFHNSWRLSFFKFLCRIKSSRRATSVMINSRVSCVRQDSSLAVLHGIYLFVLHAN